MKTIAIALILLGTSAAFGHQSKGSFCAQLEQHQNALFQVQMLSDRSDSMFRSFVAVSEYVGCLSATERDELCRSLNKDRATKILRSATVLAQINQTSVGLIDPKGIPQTDSNPDPLSAEYHQLSEDIASLTDQIEEECE